MDSPDREEEGQEQTHCDGRVQRGGEGGGGGEWIGRGPWDEWWRGVREKFLGRPSEAIKEMCVVKGNLLHAIPARQQLLYSILLATLMQPIPAAIDAWEAAVKQGNDDEAAARRDDVDRHLVFKLMVQKGLLATSGTSLCKGDKRLKKVTEFLLQARLVAAIRALQLSTTWLPGQQARMALLEILEWEEQERLGRFTRRREQQQQQGARTRGRDEQRELDERMRRAHTAVERGMVSSAARFIFGASGLADVSCEETMHALRKLHPDRDRSRCMPTMSPEQPMPTINAEDLIALAEKRIDDRKAPGCSGTTGAHFLPLLRSHRCLPALSRELTLIAQGRLPPVYKMIMTASRLIPLAKPPKGVRPIAVAEFPVRLVGKMLKAKVGAKTIRSLFPSIQMGLAPSGIDRSIHSLQLHWEEEGLRSRARGVLALDQTNAYNRADRVAMLEAVMEQSLLAPTVPYLMGLYEQDSELVVYDGLQLVDTIRSAQGCRQGCVFGPLLYALAIQPSYEATMRAAEAARVRHGLLDTTAPPVGKAILDDMTVAAHPRVLVDTLRQYLDNLPIGMEVNRDKTVLCLDGEESVDAYVREQAAEMGIRLSYGSTRILGAWVGERDRLTTNAMLEKYGEDAKMQQALQTLVQADRQLLPVQDKLLILRMSHGHRVDFLGRCMPPNVTHHVCKGWDQRLMEATMEVLNVTAMERTSGIREKMARPIRLGGFGIHASSEVSLPAYLAATMTMVMADRRGVLPAAGTHMRAEMDRVWGEIVGEMRKHGGCWRRFTRSLCLSEEAGEDLAGLGSTMARNGGRIYAKVKSLDNRDDSRHNLILFDEARREAFGWNNDNDDDQQEGDGGEQEEEGVVVAGGNQGGGDIADEGEGGGAFTGEMAAETKLQKLLSLSLTESRFVTNLVGILRSVKEMDNAFGLLDRQMGAAAAVGHGVWDRCEMARIKAHKLHDSLVHTRAHLDTSANTFLHIIPTLPELRLSDNEMWTQCRNRLNLSMSPGCKACQYRHRRANKDFNFATCGALALEISPHHRDYCYHGVNYRRTHQHNGAVKGLQQVLRFAGYNLVDEPDVETFCMLNLRAESELRRVATEEEQVVENVSSLSPASPICQSSPPSSSSSFFSPNSLPAWGLGGDDEGPDGDGDSELGHSLVAVDEERGEDDERVATPGTRRGPALLGDRPSRARDIDPTYMQVEGVDEADGDVEALIWDQRGQRGRLRGDIGVLGSPNNLPTMIDVTASALMAPSYLTAAKSRLYNRRAKADSLGIQPHLLQQEQRKIRHYAQFLRTDARVPQVGGAWTAGDVFSKLGICFVPGAISIFGNRGRALDSFLDTVSKDTPSFNSQFFLDPIETLPHRQQHAARTRDLFRAFLAIGFIRGLTQANQRGDARAERRLDSDRFHATYLHPLIQFPPR